MKGVVPEGWIYCRLSDVVIVNPPKPPTDELSQNTPVTFVPMSAVAALSGTITTPEERGFAKVRKGYTAFRNNDVIFAKITPCMENGKAAIARNLTNGIGFGSTEFHVLRTYGAVLPKYIFHFIRQQSFRNKAKNQMTGSVGQKRVPRGFLENALFPLPPMAEQERIVTKVEELLSSVDKTKEHLQKVPAILDNFRKAVLDAACSGRLTGDWREEHPNIEQATRLLRQVKDRLGIVDNKSDSIDFELELPKKWVSARIREFTTKVGSGSTPRGGKSSYKTAGIPLIRSLNVHFDGFRDEGIAYIDEKQAKSLDAVAVEAGDVLLNITGASIGRVTQVPPHMKGARVSQHVCIIRPDEVVNPTWLSYFLASPFMQAHITKIQYGVTRQALTKELILNLTVPIPSVEEQKEIVHRIKNLFKLTNEVQERYQRISDIVNKLSQAILSKAFRGELVPTEAELAEKEGRDYETAEQLLARIKAEREKQPKEKRKVRKIMKRKTVKKETLPFEGRENRVLEAILKTKGRKVTPEQLFKMTGFNEGLIDDFFEELRAAIQAGQIRESRPKKTEIYLEAINR
jgi:type I restriction enzyme, S subunit